MPAPDEKLGKAAADVADAIAPALLRGRGLTLVVVVANAEGYVYSLRGELAVGIMALEAAAADARKGEGFTPYSPASA